MAERAVAPRVLHHHAHVRRAVDEHEQRTRERRGRRVRAEELRVRAQLVVDPTRELLGDHLRGAALGVTDEWNGAHRDAHREERARDGLGRLLHLGIRRRGGIERRVQPRELQREEVVLE